MKNNKSLLKNTIILTAGMVLPKLFTVLTIPIYSSYLNSTEFGNIDYVTTLILSLVVPIITLQLENGVFRFLIDAKNKNEKIKYISSAFWVISLFTLLTMGLTFLIPLPGISTYAQKIIISFYIGVETYILFFRNVIRGLGNNTVYALSSIVSVIVNFMMMMITIMYFRLGALGMLLSLLLADVVSLIFVVIKGNVLPLVKFSGVDKVYLSRLLNYSLPLIPNTISWFIINLSDKTIIMSFLNASASGIYATAYKIPNIFNMFYSAFNLAWTEDASRNANKKGMSRYYSKMFNKMFKILSAGVLLLISFSKIIFFILVRGKEYYSAINYMPLLIISTYLSCIASFYGSIYIACKDPKKTGFSSIIAAIVNLIVHFSLIRLVGLYAAAISTFISFLVLTLYRGIDIQLHHYQIRYNIRLISFICVLIILEIILYFNSSYIALMINILISLYVCYFLHQNMIKRIKGKIINFIS